jgi:hypothetical protein
MSDDSWTVWSWNETRRSWYETGSGTGQEARQILESKRTAAARIMPDARFTMTPKGVIPQEPPDDIDREIAEDAGLITPEQIYAEVAGVIGNWLGSWTEPDDGQPQRRIRIDELKGNYAHIMVEGAPHTSEPDKRFTVTWRVTEREEGP